MANTFGTRHVRNRPGDTTIPQAVRTAQAGPAIGGPGYDGNLTKILERFVLAGALGANDLLISEFLLLPKDSILYDIRVRTKKTGGPVAMTFHAINVTPTEGYAAAPPAASALVSGNEFAEIASAGDEFTTLSGGLDLIGEYNDTTRRIFAKCAAGGAAGDVYYLDMSFVNVC